MFDYDELRSPLYFYIVLTIGVIWIFFNLFKSNMPLFAQSLSRQETKKIHVGIPILLVSIFTWFLLAFSAGMPIKYHESESSYKDVRDIYFVVDVSRSMLAVDFIPNRLEVSKNHIRDFIKLRGQDRLGIIIFAEKIITLSPLTFDQNSLLDKVDEINVGFLGNGTNIGDALGLASKRLMSSDAKEKIIILLTDGVSNVGNLNPLQAAKFAKESGVKIYSVGIGTDKSARLPYKVGGRTFYQEIPGGSIDIGTLKKISKSTQGNFYYAKSSATLGSVFADINRLEKTKVEININKKFKYKYGHSLYLGVMMLILLELFFAKKRILGV